MPASGVEGVDAELALQVPERLPPLSAEHAERVRVLDVTPDVGNLVRHLDDASFKGRALHGAGAVEGREVAERLSRVQPVFVYFTTVGDDTVAHGVGQGKVMFDAVGVFEQFNVVDEMQSVPLVPETDAERLARQPIEDLLAAMPEGRVPEVMSERDGARQMDIQSQSLGNRRADRLDVQDVLHAGADMIVFHVGEYLCLVLESSERRRVQDPCIVTVETVAQRIPLIERLLSFGQRVVALGARHGGDAGKLRCIHGATSLYFHCNILWRD